MRELIVTALALTLLTIPAVGQTSNAPQSPNPYATITPYNPYPNQPRSRGEGELAVQAVFPGVTIVRPTVM